MNETKSPNRSLGWKIAVLILSILLIASAATVLAYMSKAEGLTAEVQELNAGLDKTYSERYNDGYADGRAAGYKFGYNDGENTGYEEGKGKGLIEGWEASLRDAEFVFFNNHVCIIPYSDNNYHHYGCPYVGTGWVPLKVCNVSTAERDGFSPCPLCWESGLIEEGENLQIRQRIDKFYLQLALQADSDEASEHLRKIASAIEADDASNCSSSTSEQQRQQNSSAQSTDSSQPQTYTVYVTATGSKYHRAGCSYLKSSRAISLSDAIAAGYTPCSRCKP